jgi:hypothetical protein
LAEDFCKTIFVFRLSVILRKLFFLSFRILIWDALTIVLCLYLSLSREEPGNNSLKLLIALVSSLGNLTKTILLLLLIAHG